MSNENGKRERPGEEDGEQPDCDDSTRNVEQVLISEHQNATLTPPVAKAIKLETPDPIQLRDNDVSGRLTLAAINTTIREEAMHTVEGDTKPLASEEIAVKNEDVEPEYSNSASAVPALNIKTEEEPEMPISSESIAGVGSDPTSGTETKVSIKLEPTCAVAEEYPSFDTGAKANNLIPEASKSAPIVDSCTIQVEDKDTDGNVKPSNAPTAVEVKLEAKHEPEPAFSSSSDQINQEKAADLADEAAATFSATTATTTIEAAMEVPIVLDRTGATSSDPKANDSDLIPQTTAAVIKPVVSSTVAPAPAASTTSETSAPPPVGAPTAKASKNPVPPSTAAVSTTARASAPSATAGSNSKPPVSAAPRRQPAPASSKTNKPGSFPGVPPHHHHRPGPPVNAFNNPNEVIEETAIVSPLYIGRIIGKGGETIRDLQARSGARIDVDPHTPMGQARVITYRGTRKTVEFAKELVAMLSREGSKETDLPLGDARREQLVIPSQTVGKVIGRGGELIRELQSRSQAKIQIDHSGQSGLPTDQKHVTITGTSPAVIKAKEMVLFLVSNPQMDAMQSLNILVEEKTRTNAAWGTGPPYINLPNNGHNMTPSLVQMFLPGAGGSVAMTAAAGGGMYGAPSLSGGGAYGGGGSVPPFSLQGPSPPVGGGGGGFGTYGSGAMGPGGGGGAAAAAGYQETELIFAQRQYMGRIIGHKGVTINDLQRRSGTDIQINQENQRGPDCEITLKGTRQGIEMAKQMINEIIVTGPQHPYAGGADRGGVSSMPMSGGGAFQVGGGPPMGGGVGGVGGNYVAPSGGGGGMGGTYGQPPPQQSQAYPSFLQQNYEPSQQGAYGQGFGGQTGYANAPGGMPFNSSNNPMGYDPAPLPQQPQHLQHQAPSAYGQQAGFAQAAPVAPTPYNPHYGTGTNPAAVSTVPFHQQLQLQTHGGAGPYGGYAGGGASAGMMVPPPAAPSVPMSSSDWKTARSADGAVYYYNERTGETQWDKPAGML